jgi:hypothetical protein
VVRQDDERRRLWEGSVVGEDSRVDVAVRTDDGQPNGLFIKGASQSPNRRVRIKEAVVVH